MRLDHLLFKKKELLAMCTASVSSSLEAALLRTNLVSKPKVCDVLYEKQSFALFKSGCFLPRPVRDMESLKPQGCGRKGKGSLKSHREGTETAVLEGVRPEKEEAAAASTGAGSLNKKPARCELCSAMGRMRWRS